MRPTVPALRYLIARVGAADHAAFRSLYVALAPSTLTTIRRVITDQTHAVHVLRGTFCEVWWMSAFDVRAQTQPKDVTSWVEGIAQRRSAERSQALDWIARDEPATESTEILIKFVDDHDLWTESQLAAMLNGRDAMALPKSLRRRAPRLEQPRVEPAQVEADERLGAWQLPVQIRRVSHFRSPDRNRSDSFGAPTADSRAARATNRYRAAP
jgi:hypothetical protein